jgi:hypothetical protein
MKIKLVVESCFLLIGIAGAYDKKNLDTFLQTGKCPKCDLFGAYISP